MKKTKQMQSEGKPKSLPSKECLECKLFRTFVTCFGLTFADMKHKGLSRQTSASDL